jgi:ArsR family transcriptional regulator
MSDDAALFKALSSEPRLKIVRLLKEHPQCVNALAQRLGMSQSAVSQHLRVLREAGLAKAHKRGNWMHYEMPRTGLERCGRVLAEVFGVAIKPAKPGRGTLNCPPALLKECGPLKKNTGRK